MKYNYSLCIDAFLYISMCTNCYIFFFFFYETCCRASVRVVLRSIFFIMLSFLQTAGRQNARVKYNTLCPFYKPNSKRAEAANQYI